MTTSATAMMATLNRLGSRHPSEYAKIVQKVDVAQRVDELNLSSIRICGCATRGTKRPWAA